MIEQPLTQVLILLAAAVFVVALARRAGWPPILGYLVVGLALGPHALAIIPSSELMHVVPELGVVFLVFTLGLEFSLPRMIAMRREVFGLGALQVCATLAACAALAHLAGASWLVAALIGGSVAMSSTAIILRQLGDRGELNRTHGRLAFAMLLFQDLAFVPLLALATGLDRGHAGVSLRSALLTAAAGVLAVVVVLAAGRWLLRPLFREIAHSRLRELFTLTALFVVLAAAWVSYVAGLSLALGAFLAGMMLGETEYRYQVEAVIRPFRDILLGLFFISVGMLLDVRVLAAQLLMVSAMLAGMLIVKTAIAALAARLFVDSTFKALRAAVVVAIGGEFGIALLTILIESGAGSPLGQPLLVAVVISMVLSPLIVDQNRAIARAVLRQRGPRAAPLEPENGATGFIAKREHVILCGYGRVGQNVARVLESQGFEYIALDLDPARIRAARQAGEPVLFGDSADEEMLVKAGIDHASAVVVSFSNPAVALGIVRSVRRMRSEVPLLVRTADDARLKELKDAGATEVVPETFEASLMLVSQVLMLLHVPVSRVVHTVGAVRASRYQLLRSIHRREDPRPAADDAEPYREELKSIVVPPGAWAVGRTVSDLRARGAEVAITGIRRHGILGREPTGETRIREGDIVIVYGLPEALEHAEGVLLAG
ncbi:MAG TPA: cation:proton antiporter [Steroidobacteraceae bacterium]|nr:cation:proton antiporter [Steroidobacteraceae bacterium]